MMDLLLGVCLILGLFIFLHWYTKYCPARFKLLRALFIGYGWPLIVFAAMLLAVYAALRIGYKNQRD